VIEETMELSQAVFQGAGCVVETRIDPGLPLVMADPMALKQALSKPIQQRGQVWNPGQQLVSRDELLEAVWEYQPGVSSGTIDVHVAWLRLARLTRRLTLTAAQAALVRDNSGRIGGGI
jgi:hypothetical protein